jgi:hypothetical protein
MRAAEGCDNLVPNTAKPFAEDHSRGQPILRFRFRFSFFAAYRAFG